MHVIKTWKASLFSFCDRRILSIFLLGFSSGVPFLLTLSTLSVWLKESGINNTTIGLFVLATLPYTFKFLWGPVVDRVRIPVLFPLLGQRRSWILLAQLALIGMLVGLGSSHPEISILGTALWTLGVAFCSAVQDIVIEAYRIEMSETQVGPGASAIALGWRLGLMVSGAGALFLAAALSWQMAYNLMAAVMLVGVATTLCSRSPANFVAKAKWAWSSFRGLDWRVVLAFIFLFKVGDTVLNVMNTPFLVELGFTKYEIAHVAKFFGISTMIVGGFLGGIFLSRFGVFRSLILCAALQFISSLMFVLQATVGHDLYVLMATIGIENLSFGVCATAFIAYLSSLCSMPHTATHYAILSSFGSLVRIVLSIGAGILADLLPWTVFFGVTAAACLPCFLLLMRTSKFRTVLE